MDERGHDPAAGRPARPSGPAVPGEPEALASPTLAARTPEPEGVVGVPAARPPTPLTQQVGRVTVIALAVLFVVFALVNLQPVTFSWIFGRSTAVTTPAGDTTGGVPLILLLVTSFLMGAVVGAGLTWRRGRVRRRQRTEARG